MEYAKSFNPNPKQPNHLVEVKKPTFEVIPDSKLNQHIYEQLLLNPKRLNDIKRPDHSLPEELNEAISHLYIALPSNFENRPQIERMTLLERSAWRVVEAFANSPAVQEAASALIEDSDEN